MWAGDTLPPMAHWQLPAIHFFFTPPPLLSSLVLFAVSHFFHPFVYSTSFFPFNCLSPFPSPHSFRFTSSFFILYFSLAALMFLYLTDFPLSPHDWSLISNSIINWSLINGWLIQRDHNNEDADNRSRKPLSASNTDDKSLCLVTSLQRGWRHVWACVVSWHCEITSNKTTIQYEQV